MILNKMIVNLKNIKFLFIISLTIISFTKSQNELIATLKQEVSHLSCPAPGDYGRLVNNIKADSQCSFFNLQMSNYVQELQNKKVFTHEVIEKFKGLLYAKSLVFKGFHLAITMRHGHVEQLIGVGRNRGDGTADIGYVMGRTTGTVIPQFQSKKVRECKRILFWKKCKDKWITVPRGMTPQELLTVTNALQAATYNKMNVTVQTIRGSSFKPIVKMFNLALGNKNEIEELNKLTKTAEDSIENINVSDKEVPESIAVDTDNVVTNAVIDVDNADNAVVEAGNVEKTIDSNTIGLKFLSETD